MSSIRLPVEEVNFRRSFSSSKTRAFLLSEHFYISYLRLISNCFYSLDKTLLKSYCSKPVYVTVKSMIRTLAESSGENLGLEILVNKNILKLSLYSIYCS